jgi:1-phosphofructokinase family hexose kinase
MTEPLPGEIAAYDIVTVSPSLAVDSYYVLSQLEIGEVNRAGRTIHTAGGKGINMARAVASLGGRVLAIGVVGGPTGQLVAQQLAVEGIPHDLVWGETLTRQSCTLVVPEKSSTTVILESGSPLDDGLIESIRERARVYAVQSGWLALTGSLPPNVPASFYADLIEEIKSTSSVQVAVDAAGESLRLAALAGPHVIKVNAAEFLQAFNIQAVQDWPQVRKIYLELAPRGLEILVVTDGARGAYIFSPDPQLLHVSTRLDRWLSTTGAGDTFLAGLLLALGKGESLEAAACFASAAAAASIQHIGCGVLDLVDVQRYQNDTCVKRMEYKD